MNNPSPPRPWRLAPDVTRVEQDGTSWLLDLARGRFYALSPTANEMLTLALEVGSAEATRRLAADYGVPAGRIGADLERLLADLASKGLLAAAPRPPRPPSRLLVAVLLTWAWLCVRLLGWARTVRLWRRRQPSAHDLHGAASADDLLALDGRVRDAAAWHPLNAQCKERALVAWHLLRRRYRLPAELVVGAQMYPFCMHVWVECQGQLLTDDRARCEAYAPVARFA